VTTIDVRTGGRSAGEVLAWSRDLVEPAVRTAVGTPAFLNVAHCRLSLRVVG
jgi:hypothetical protein